MGNLRSHCIFLSCIWTYWSGFRGLCCHHWSWYLMGNCVLGFVNWVCLGNNPCADEEQVTFVYPVILSYEVSMLFDVIKMNSNRNAVALPRIYN